MQSTQSDTNVYGCVGSYSITASLIVNVKSQPIISASDYVICPNGSVTLSSNSPLGNAWEGPNGSIPGTGSSISVSDPGQYFSVVTDGDSCGLVSNTLTIQQYTTPKLIVIGDTMICPGGSTILMVQANTGSTVTWAAPFSGSTSFSQVVTTPGVYSCSITSCNIVTVATVTITAGNPLAKIIPQGVLCHDSSIVLTGPAGMSSYLWLPGNYTTQNIVIDSSGTYTPVSYTHLTLPTTPYV